MKARSGALPCPTRKQSRKKWERRLLAYRQDFLQPRVRTAVERHLLYCGECRKLLDEVTMFLNRLEVTMTLLASKVPIENLEMEAYRLKMRRKMPQLT